MVVLPARTAGDGSVATANAQCFRGSPRVGGGRAESFESFSAARSAYAECAVSELQLDRATLAKVTAGAPATLTRTDSDGRVLLRHRLERLGTDQIVLVPGRDADGTPVAEDLDDCVISVRGVRVDAWWC